MHIDKIKVTKVIVGFVAGAATGSVVKEIIKNNVSPEKVTDTVAVFIASWILAGIAGAAAATWTDAKIDEYIAQWNKLAAARDAVA